MEPCKDLSAQVIIVGDYYTMVFVVQFVARMELVCRRRFGKLRVVRITGLEATPERFNGRV